jgi:transcriptional regulator with XRE-family HTH domain
MAVGQNIKEWREKRSYSQVELARLVGISANSLYRIEKESNIPRPQTLRKIAEVLGVTPETLLSGAEVKNEPEAEAVEDNIEPETPEPVEELAPAGIFEPLGIAEQAEKDRTEIHPVAPIPAQVATRPESAKPRIYSNRVVLAALAGLFAVVIGLVVWNVLQFQQLQTIQANQILNERGLDLITGTEISNDRLNPVAGPAEKEHGHWFHKKDANTQVLVIELMPPLGAGESYYGWFQLADGSWQLAAHFELDSNGYARSILVGSDGSNVKAVLITRQNAATSAPAGTDILRFP